MMIIFAGHGWQILAVFAWGKWRGEAMNCGCSHLVPKT